MKTICLGFLCILLIGLSEATFSCNRMNRKLTDVTGDFSFAKGKVHRKCLAAATKFNTFFTSGNETGASFAVTYKGCPVIDLWGGNRTDTTQWESNTIVPIFSASKGFLAYAVAKAMQLRRAKYTDLGDDRLPGYGVNGKQNNTLLDIFTFRSGVIASDVFYNSTQSLDQTYMDYLVKNSTPTHPQGSHPGVNASYSPVWTGHERDAFVRALDPMGRNVPEIIRDDFIEVDSNTEDIEVLYTPTAEDADRIATLDNQAFRAQVNYFLALFCATPGYEANCRALRSPTDTNADIFNINNPAYWNLYEPAGHVWSNARTLAKFYGFLVTPKFRHIMGLLKNKNFKAAIENQYYGPDLSAGGFAAITAAGWENPSTTDPFSPNPCAFGRNGLSGVAGYGAARKCFDDNAEEDDPQDDESCNEVEYPDMGGGFGYAGRFGYFSANPNAYAALEAGRECIAAIKASRDD